MKDFIFGKRNGIYIIDLQKTIKIFREALNFLRDISEEGQIVLMVGTKKQAQDIIKEYAEKSESCYVNNRWLGGLLTNYKVIRKSVDRLIELEEMKEDGRWELLSKKEQSRMEKVYRKYDAVRAIELFVSKAAEAIIEGKKRRLEKELLQEREAEEEKEGVAEAASPEAEISSSEEHKTSSSENSGSSQNEKT